MANEKTISQLVDESKTAKFVSRDYASTVAYEDFSEDFKTDPDAKYNFEGVEYNIVHQYKASGQKVLVLSIVAGVEYRVVVLDASDDSFIMDLELTKTRNVFTNMLIGIGLISNGTHAQDKHRATAFLNIVENQDYYPIIGSSDQTGKITFNGWDVLYLLLNKGEGKGRKSDPNAIKNAGLYMNQTTKDLILSMPEFKGLVFTSKPEKVSDVK